MLLKKKQIELTEEQKEEIRIKDFFDRILPSTIKFSTDHYIIGDSYRCVWAFLTRIDTELEKTVADIEDYDYSA